MSRTGPFRLRARPCYMQALLSTSCQVSAASRLECIIMHALEDWEMDIECSGYLLAVHGIMRTQRKALRFRCHS